MLFSMYRVLVLILMAATIAPLQAKSDPVLQGSLETVYSQWRRSMIRKDYQAWKRTTAYARQIETRNVVISKREKFPAAVFALPMKPPAIAGLRALSVRAKGPTATAVYYGKVNFEVGGQAPSHSLLVLRYLKEGAQWKFYRMAVMSQLPGEVIGSIRANRLDFLQEPEFQPIGRGPKIQQPCPQPDYVTDLHIISLGFDTEVTINGISEHATSDHFGTQLVIGGLKKGKNTIKIKSKRLRNAESGEKNLKVTVHVKTGRRNDPAVKVFEFKPDPDKGPFTFTGDIVANPAKIGRLAR